MLKNKYAIITGGSDGIGFAIAKAFASNGANICLIARNKDRLETAKEELSRYGTEIHTLAADLSCKTDVKAVAQQIMNIFPGVDILVNNAGIARFIPFSEMDEEALDTHIELNIKAPYLLTRYLFESLSERKGNIINISSYFSHRMLPGRCSTAYSLTKGAIDSFTKSLAFEVGQQVIRVNAIAPGSVRTPLFENNLSKLSEEEQRKFNSMIQTIYPLQKVGTPEDIAEAAVYLASDKAQWVTGIILNVDGGLTN